MRNFGKFDANQNVNDNPIDKGYQLDNQGIFDGKINTNTHQEQANLLEQQEIIQQEKKNHDVFADYIRVMHGPDAYYDIATTLEVESIEEFLAEYLGTNDKVKVIQAKNSHQGMQEAVQIQSTMQSLSQLFGQITGNNTSLNIADTPKYFQEYIKLYLPGNEGKLSDAMSTYKKAITKKLREKEEFAQTPEGKEQSKQKEQEEIMQEKQEKIRELQNIQRSGFPKYYDEIKILEEYLASKKPINDEFNVKYDKIIADYDKRVLSQIIDDNTTLGGIIDREKSIRYLPQMTRFCDSLVGAPYTRGGGRMDTSIGKIRKKGCDCSGLIYAMCNKLRLPLPGKTSGQMFQNTLGGSIANTSLTSNDQLKNINSQIKTGQLVFRKSSNKKKNRNGNGVHHVAMVASPPMINGKLNVYQSTGKKGVHKGTIDIDRIKKKSSHKSDIHIHNFDWESSV